jgi:protein TonB
MDLQTNLIESGNKKKRRSWKQLLFSIGFHGGLLAAIIFISATATHKVAAEDKSTPVFLSQGAAPPPPPPPPPPPAGAPQRATPKTTPIQQPKIVQPSFVQPREIPKETPKVEQTVVKTEDLAPSPAQEAPSAPPAGGVAGGVEGGVVGGEKGGAIGGEVGGQIGGVIGGEKGGVVGGQLGGKVGGTGTGSEGEGNGGNESPSGPLRVGGDVKAPTVVSRVEPQYNEAARKARITGVVIVEAIINKEGRVEQVKVIKGLPMGLSDAAEEAVKGWRFRPGTLNGQPVEVIFNLTVNFTLG